MTRADALAFKSRDGDPPCEEIGAGVVPTGPIAEFVCVDLVMFLLECARGPVFILDASEKVVATNHAGRVFLRAGRELRRVIAACDDAIVDTSLGPVRTVRRRFATPRGTYQVVVLAELFAVDTAEILRTAVARWRPTARQAAVLRLVLEGLANKEIAAHLAVSPRTVEVHVTALLEKAGVDSRARLIAKSRELALAELPEHETDQLGPEPGRPATREPLRGMRAEILSIEQSERDEVDEVRQPSRAAVFSVSPGRRPRRAPLPSPSRR